MTKHKFSIGDRVAVYLGVCRTVCIVTDMEEDGALKVKQVDVDDDWQFIAHPKQCRKLSKKPARTWWVRKSKMDFEVRVKPFDRVSRDWIEVREVRRKKIK